MVARFDIYLLNLDPAVGREAKNTRPCVVVSPDELNRNLSSIIVAPISASTGDYPTRIPVSVLNTERFIILDQLRTVDKDRLAKKIGEIDKASQKQIVDRLQELFAE